MGRTAVFLFFIILSFIVAKGQTESTGYFVSSDSVEYVYEYDTITLEADTMVRVDTIIKYIENKKKLNPFRFRYNYQKKHYYWFQGLRWSASLSGYAANNGPIKNSQLADSLNLSSTGNPDLWGGDFRLSIHLENIFYGLGIVYLRRQVNYQADWHERYLMSTRVTFGNATNYFKDSIDQKIQVNYTNIYEFVPLSLHIGYNKALGKFDFSVVAGYHWYIPINIRYYTFERSLTNPEEKNTLDHIHYSGARVQLDFGRYIGSRTKIMLGLVGGRAFGTFPSDPSLTSLFYGISAGLQYNFFDP